MIYIQQLVVLQHVNCFLCTPVLGTHILPFDFKWSKKATQLSCVAFFINPFLVFELPAGQNPFC